MRALGAAVLIALAVAGCDTADRPAASRPTSTTAAAPTPATQAPPACETDQRKDYLAGGPGHPSPEEAAKAGVLPGPWRFERVDGDRSFARLRVVNTDNGHVAAVVDAAAEDGSWRLVAAERCKGAAGPSPV